MVSTIKTALKLVFLKFMKVVAAQTIKTARFKTQLKRLLNTLKSIHPLFYESWRLNRLLDRPLKETFIFISYLKRGRTLVLKTSRISFRNQDHKIRHLKKLIRLNRRIAKFFQTESQVKRVSGIHHLENKMDQLLSDFNTGGSVVNSSLHSVLSSQELAFNDEELTLEASSETYSLPDSIKGMGQLKALTVKSYTDYPSKIHHLSLIECLPNLRMLRFEHVSVSSLEPVFALKNLTRLSFVMCEIGEALMNDTTHSLNTLPNLTTLEIDMCYDVKELPSWLCNLVHLQKLNITNCQELDDLPKGFGLLSKLEVLNLHCCTKLQELPESIANLHKLRSLDISDCLSISVLPEEIGELCGLRVIKMNGCGGLQELPMPTSELLKLEEVICDEETSYLWMDFETDLPNLKINVVEDDRLESFMKIVQ